MVNPILEGGFFLILFVLAFGFLIYSFKAPSGKGMLKIMSMALFSILAIFIGSGYEVAFTSKAGGHLVYNSTGFLLTNQTDTVTENVILPGGEDSSWMSWLFSGFAMANIIFLLKDYKEGT